MEFWNKTLKKNQNNNRTALTFKSFFFENISIETVVRVAVRGKMKYK